MIEVELEGSRPFVFSKEGHAKLGLLTSFAVTLLSEKLEVIHDHQ